MMTEKNKSQGDKSPYIAFTADKNFNSFFKDVIKLHRLLGITKSNGCKNY
jgi:hypothetical protein